MENLKQIIAARIIKTAASIGSKAQTVKGAHKAIMNISWGTISRQGITPKWYERKENKSFCKSISQQKRSAKYKSKIELGPNSVTEVEAEVKDRKRKNWENTVPSFGNFGPCVEEIDNGRYSSRCTFTHWTYKPTVSSWGFVKEGLGLEFQYSDNDKVLLVAPHGYTWAIDNNGIHIIDSTGKKDYHPNSDDLRNYSKSSIRQKAVDNYTTLKALAAESRKKEKETSEQKKHNLQLIRKAEREGAAICLKDNLRAGNCQAGTTNFANRHGLDIKKHYRPTDLLKIANGNADRVALAVAVGLRRHYSEMRQGFCELENHVA